MSAIPIAALGSRLSFSALLDQRGRLLQVECALPSLALVPERLVLRESLNQPFEMLLDCLSTSAHFELKQLIGEQISVRLLQADGSHKPFHGYVFEASQLGADGGLARYRLAMRPWSAFMALRRDAFIWQDKTALAIVEDVFKDYPQAHYRIEVSEPLRTRSLCTQYQESDFTFIHRLLAEEGLTTHIEHLAGEAATSADNAGHARHVLVITDRLTPRPSLGPIRFARQHPTANLAGQKDAITAFATARSLQPNAVTRGAWDYKHLVGTTAQDASTLSLGEVPALEHYDGSGAYRFESLAHAERAASLALQALELGVKRFEGQGSARHLEAGRRFELIDHPLYGANTSALDNPGARLASHTRDDNAFTLLAVEHHATNNLGAQAAELLALTALERGTYRNHFHAAPAAAPLVPRHTPKPTAPGAQTALVVGIEGERLTTERDHRIKLQFPWQRGQRPLAGGLDHDPSSADTAGNAPGNERSGTWVRVALPSAGANWGAVLVPRVGTEVAVAFVEGDIDRPIVIGQLYNGQDLPPFAAGVDSGANHPGVISGMHTKALDGAGFNQWALDDATGQLRMRMLSSYAQAELGLGHLIGQAAASAQRGSWRGAGFEANTAGWGSVRAGQGLLISTTARAGSHGSAQGTQMGAAEALAQLRGAASLGERLGQAARASGAAGLKSFEAAQAVAKLADGIDPTKTGKHAQSVNGQQATKPAADGRSLGAESVEAFEQPVVVLDSPSTVAFTSETGLEGFSGQGLSVAAQGDLQFTAGATFSAVAGQTGSVFTHQGGIKAFAANGPVSLRAHTDRLEILADQDVTVVSVNEQITVSASSKIEVIAGQSSITLDGGDIEFKTPGRFQAKLSVHAFLGAGSQGATLAALPTGTTSEPPTFMELNLHDEWLMPVPGAPYRVVFDDGTVREGTLDDNGHARLDGVPNKMARVYYGEDPRPPEARVEMPVSTFKGGSATNEEAIANIERYIADSDKFWAEQATSAQREVFAEFNAEPDEPDGENAWHFLDEAQQAALRDKLARGNA